MMEYGARSRVGSGSLVAWVLGSLFSWVYGLSLLRLFSELRSKKICILGCLGAISGFDFAHRNMMYHQPLLPITLPLLDETY